MMKKMKRDQRLVILTLGALLLPLVVSLWMIHRLGEISDMRFQLYKARNVIELINSDLRKLSPDRKDSEALKRIDSNFSRLDSNHEDHRALVEETRGQWRKLEQSTMEKVDIERMQNSLEMIVQHEKKIMDRSGSQIFRLYDTVAIFLFFTTVSMAILLGYVFSRIRRTNGEFLRLAQEALAATKSKAQFMATISHEIRTPLNGIVGMSGLLAEEELPENMKSKVNVIKDSAQVLLSIVSDILDYSRIEERGVELRVKAFSLHHVLENVDSLLREKALRKGLGFHLTKNLKESVWIRGDDVKLGQVLINLVNNAIKFTQQGEINLTVSGTELANEKYLLELNVQDTGIGLASDQLEKIFSPFSQEHKIGTSGEAGAGLGLSISRAIVAAMGGKITVDSVAGKGSTFTVNLVMDLTEELSRESVLPEKPKYACRVLIVEDNFTNQQVAELSLEHLGVESIIAQNGQEAIDFLKKEKVDLILMDCQMPVMDGYEGTKLLRASGNMTPIVAMTANYSQEDRQRCLDVGMNDVLLKPFSLSALQDVLRKYLMAAAMLDPARVLREQLGEEAWVRIRGTFLKSLDGLDSQILKLQEEMNFSKVRQLGHRFKSSGAFVGANELSLICAAIEKAPDEELEKLIPEAVKLIRQTESAFKKEDA